MSTTARRGLVASLVAASRRRWGTEPVGRVRFGALRRLGPISDRWGFERGTPIDRLYIERFLARYASDIGGRVVEIGDATYTERFGTAVETSDVLDVSSANRRATIVTDLTREVSVEAQFDCAIVTQTLHQIYDVHAAVRSLHAMLRPGGVMLATFPGITRVGGEPGWPETWYWSLTAAGAQLLFDEVFGDARTQIETFGNVLTAVCFLHGIAAGELEAHELAYHDPRYEVLVAVRAVRAE